MELYTRPELERFNSAWIPVNDCKLWTRFLDKDGYGTFYFRKKLRRAHRVAYYFSKGPIEKGLVIDHICKNRNCVEIKHLRLVTTLQNSLENSKSVGAINKNKTHCPQKHPYDRKYGKQRYCSICEKAKKKRLVEKWREEANKIAC